VVTTVADRHVGQLSDEEVAELDVWWRANNYVTIGPIYPQGDALLRRPIEPGNVKPLSRLIRHTGQPAINRLGAVFEVEHLEDLPELCDWVRGDRVARG
jgi:phosphoketolase